MPLLVYYVRSLDIPKIKKYVEYLSSMLTIEKDEETTFLNSLRTTVEEKYLSRGRLFYNIEIMSRNAIRYRGILVECFGEMIYGFIRRLVTPVLMDRRVYLLGPRRRTRLRLTTQHKPRVSGAYVPFVPFVSFVSFVSFLGCFK